MKVLTIDVGGTNVKILATGEKERRKLPSGPKMTPQQMVTEVKKLAEDWEYDAVSIGYPGQVAKGRIESEPHNLAPGWRKFDFEAAFKCPVKIMNDAAMQALGSYSGGLLLFLGLGTGLGSAMVAEGVVIPMELGHLSYRNGTFEEYLGVAGLKRRGKKKWRAQVAFAVGRWMEALHTDDVVLGGGNAKKLKEVPPGCRIGSNAYAFLGGFRLWDPVADRTPGSSPVLQTIKGPRS
ncbi:MAG TPA: ROK family protein [Acetobacteraceae bacterium]|jgi:polyphosphate glucokinase|nr:ROK family protein [Acetobacteraceae bacterium]